MISERLCSIAEQCGKVGDLCRWRRILSAAPALENVASFHLLSAQVTCFAGNPHELLDPRIVWL